MMIYYCEQIYSYNSFRKIRASACFRRAWLRVSVILLRSMFDVKYLTARGFLDVEVIVDFLMFVISFILSHTKC